MNKMVEELAQETKEFIFNNKETLSYRDIEVEIETLKLTAYNMGRFEKGNEIYEERFRQTTDGGSNRGAGLDA